VPTAGKTDKESTISLSVGSKDVKFNVALDGKLLKEFVDCRRGEPRPFEHISIQRLGQLRKIQHGGGGESTSLVSIAFSPSVQVKVSKLILSGSTFSPRPHSLRLQKSA
jgi:hypothetical protein